MRVYLPATAADLVALRHDAAASHQMRLPIISRIGHAVTRKLADDQPGADQDELEWDAFLAAATDAAGLLIAEPSAPPMRVVLSLEVPASAVTEPPTPSDGAQFSEVTVADAPAAQVMAIHIDEPATAALINQLRAKATSIAALAGVLDADMLWYDPSEISEIPLPL